MEGRGQNNDVSSRGVTDKDGNSETKSSICAVGCDQTASYNEGDIIIINETDKL